MFDKINAAISALWKIFGWVAMTYLASFAAALLALMLAIAGWPAAVCAVIVAPFHVLTGIPMTLAHGHAFVQSRHKDISFERRGEGELVVRTCCEPIMQATSHTTECFLYGIRDDLVQTLRAHPAIIGVRAYDTHLEISHIAVADRQFLQEDIAAFLNWHLGIDMPWRIRTIFANWQWAQHKVPLRIGYRRVHEDLHLESTHEITDQQRLESDIEATWKGYFNVRPQYVILQRYYSKSNTHLRLLSNEDAYLRLLRIQLPD
jgi:hypothetical protein